MTPQERIKAFYVALDNGQGVKFMQAHATEQFTWKAGAPFGSGRGIDSWFARLISPLTQAMPILRRETHMLFGGRSSANLDGHGDGAYWVTATGYLHGALQSDWLGFKVGGQSLRLRWADFFKFDEDGITSAFSLIDIVDFLQQIGCDPFPPSKGERFIFPSPLGVDGLRNQEETSDETTKTMNLVRGLLYDGLNSFDETNLESMGIERFFHSSFRWYGPGGIGACMNLEEFQTRHQRPWLVAFPDRKAVHLDNLICDGPFCGSAWWDGVAATHLGAYLGVEATGKKLLISGIDYWLRDGDKFIENWVFIDFVDLFYQLGYDLIAIAQGLQKTRR